jgi:SP family general alpha glucoside:H+ symporter-like MFS transporter
MIIPTRVLYRKGVVVMTPIMWIVGFLALAPVMSSIAWAQSVLLLAWLSAYGISIRPISFVIASEILSSHLHSKTLSLARNSCYAMVIVNAVMAPYILNLAQGNLKCFAAFPCAAMSLFYPV